MQLTQAYVDPETFRWDRVAYTDQHLLEAVDDDALIINPVNTVGVSGAGVALRIAQAFPSTASEYRRHCGVGGALSIGRSLLFESRPWSILFVPTKVYYNDPSKLEYIEKSLHNIAYVAHEWGYSCIATTRLGCGLGKLNWEDHVEPMVQSILVQDAGLKVIVFDGNIPKQQPFELREPFSCRTFVTPQGP